MLNLGGNMILAQDRRRIMKDADQIYRHWWGEESRDDIAEGRPSASVELHDIIAKSADHRLAIQATLEALHLFALDLPQAIDFGYPAWAVAVDLIGHEAKSTTARQIFEAYLHKFDKRIWAQKHPQKYLRAMIDDPSNRRVPMPDRNIDEWITELSNWQKSRRERILVAAIKARSLAKHLLSSIPSDG